MRKLTACLLLFIFLIVILGTGISAAKLLDKASPKLANQTQTSLFSSSHLNQNLEKDNVILWTPDREIDMKSTNIAAWVIPSDLSEEKLLKKEKSNNNIREELEAVAVVIMNEFPNCRQVKNFLYLAPVKTNTRIGILSSSEEISDSKVKKAIISVFSSKDNIDNPEKFKEGIQLREINLNNIK